MLEVTFPRVPTTQQELAFKVRLAAKVVIALDSAGRTIWIADAHRGDGKRFVVRADEKLTAFRELESVTQRRGGLS